MSKCLLQKNSFINIQPFMVINLGLDGVSLLIYALIYGHTVNKGVFYGSLEYMAQWCHCTTRNITNCINALEGKGLIRRKKTPKGCFYMTEKVKTDLPEYEEEEIENPFKDEYITEESSEKKEKSSKDLEKSSYEDRKKVPENTEKSSSNILDDNLDNKLDLNSSTNSSPQPNESSYKPFVPQEENSKSHYEQSCESQPDTFVNQDLNSKSHCGKATESEEFKSQVQEIKLLYLNNYHSLFEKQRVLSEKPNVTWSRAINKIKECVASFGFDTVKKVLAASLSDDWVVSKGYVLTTILSDSIFSRLSQSVTQPDRPPYQKSYPRGSPSRQWTDDHLML